MTLSLNRTALVSGPVYSVALEGRSCVGQKRARARGLPRLPVILFGRRGSPVGAGGGRRGARPRSPERAQSGRPYCDVPDRRSGRPTPESVVRVNRGAFGGPSRVGGLEVAQRESPRSTRCRHAVGSRSPKKQGRTGKRRLGCSRGRCWVARRITNGRWRPRRRDQVTAEHDASRPQVRACHAGRR